GSVARISERRRLHSGPVGRGCSIARATQRSCAWAPSSMAYPILYVHRRAVAESVCVSPIALVHMYRHLQTRRMNQISCDLSNKMPLVMIMDSDLQARSSFLRSHTIDILRRVTTRELDNGRR